MNGIGDSQLPNGYRLRIGSPLDRALLLAFARRAYREIDPQRGHDSLSQTLDRYLSEQTPLWWIETDRAESVIEAFGGLPSRSSRTSREAIACLWLGSATTPNDAEPQAYVLLLYVAPEHRRQGLATYLLSLAEAEAQRRGDRQLGLQVMAGNDAAIALYQKLGYIDIARWMGKSLD